MTMVRHNQREVGNAGMPLRLRIERPWPAVAERHR
jgi:hypothetical protein